MRCCHRILAAAALLMTADLPAADRQPSVIYLIARQSARSGTLFLSRVVDGREESKTVAGDSVAYGYNATRLAILSNYSGIFLDEKTGKRTPLEENRLRTWDLASGRELTRCAVETGGIAWMRLQEGSACHSLEISEDFTGSRRVAGVGTK